MNIRILREAGGLGDVVCTLPVARAAREKWPDATIYHFCLDDYRDVIEHCPYVDVFVPVPMEGRRPRDQEPDATLYPYLATDALPGPVRRSLGEGGFDVTIDCWCPAYLYEKASAPKIKRSRIESFCIANDLSPSDYCPHYAVTPEEQAWAKGWIEGQAFDRKRVIGLQPYSLNKRRDWPPEKWILLSNALQEQGATVLVFHSYHEKVKDIPGRKVTGLPMHKAAAIIAQCDCMVTPDSGLFHLSAAVDVPAVGLFGSTHGHQITKHYPKHKVIWPVDVPRKKRCKSPCISFQWCGCDNECHKNGCEILTRIEVQDVLDIVEQLIQT